VRYDLVVLLKAIILCQIISIICFVLANIARLLYLITNRNMYIPT